MVASLNLCYCSKNLGIRLILEFQSIQLAGYLRLLETLWTGVRIHYKRLI